MWALFARRFSPVCAFKRSCALFDSLCVCVCVRAWLCVLRARRAGADGANCSPSQLWQHTERLCYEQAVPVGRQRHRQLERVDAWTLMVRLASGRAMKGVCAAAAKSVRQANTSSQHKSAQCKYCGVSYTRYRSGRTRMSGACSISGAVAHVLALREQLRHHSVE